VPGPRDSEVGAWEVFLGLNKMLSKIHRAVQARLEIKVSRAAGALANGVAAFAP
jgi:hypothetical protein